MLLIPGNFDLINILINASLRTAGRKGTIKARLQFNCNAIRRELLSFSHEQVTTASILIKPNLRNARGVMFSTCELNTNGVLCTCCTIITIGRGENSFISIALVKAMTLANIFGLLDISSTLTICGTVDFFRQQVTGNLCLESIWTYRQSLKMADELDTNL